jgi:hypothetical protein
MLVTIMMKTWRIMMMMMMMMMMVMTRYPYLSSKAIGIPTFSGGTNWLV